MKTCGLVRNNAEKNPLSGDKYLLKTAHLNKMVCKFGAPRVKKTDFMFMSIQAKLYIKKLGKIVPCDTSLPYSFNYSCKLNLTCPVGSGAGTIATRVKK